MYRSCIECSNGWFSLGDSPCQPCQDCPVGYGAVSPCTLTSNTECAPCSSGETYSDLSNSQQCWPCSECETLIKSECTVQADTQCSDNAECPIWMYWDPDAEFCLYCSELTEGAIQEEDCDKEGIPTKFQYSYNPADPRPYVVPTGSSQSDSTRLSLIIPLSSAVIVVAIIVIIALSVYCYRQKRHVTLHTSNIQSHPVTRDTDCHKIIGSESLIETLPRKTKGKLAACFMSRCPCPRAICYIVLAEKFNFSPEEKNELELYCQERKTGEFAEKLFEFMETKRPQPTVGQLIDIFVQEGREDLIQSLKHWLSKENYYLDMDVDTKKDEANNHLSSEDSSSPVPLSGCILIDQPDNQPLLTGRPPVEFPLPPTPPPCSPIQTFNVINNDMRF